MFELIDSKDPLAPHTWREWEKRNCKLTLASMLVYWSPGFWMIMTTDHGTVWKGLTLLTVPLGIALSRGLWRRVLGTLVWLLLLMMGHESTVDDGFVGWQMIPIWVGSFYFVWYHDGQERKRKANRREWEA